MSYQSSLVLIWLRDYISKYHVILVVFNEIAPSKNTFAGFLAEEWKIARKINSKLC